MQIMLCLLYVLLALKWAHWRKWKSYYPAYLFMLAADFSSMVITYNHTLWLFHPTFLLPNHTLTDFFLAFVAFPATVLLYLSRYPIGVLMQLLWVGLWTAAYSLTEVLTHSLPQLHHVFNPSGTLPQSWPCVASINDILGFHMAQFWVRH